MFTKINNGKFITIFNYKNISKDECVRNEKYINKIVVKNENLIPLNENKINGKVLFINEIEEENQSYLIFSQNDRLYRISKDTINPKFIADIKAYLILQINSKKYLINLKILSLIF